MVRMNCAIPAGARSTDGGSRSGSGSRPRQSKEPGASSLDRNFDLNVIFEAKFSGYNPPVPQSTMQVTLPEMGESVTEGTVAKWLKQPGDPVREGEALVEATTDKVDAEVPAPATGTLTKILAEAGKTIAVGAPLAEIAVGADGDSATKKAAAVPTAANGEEKKASTLPSPASGEGTTPRTIEVTEGAELLAKAKGIDLATVKGSGPGGSIRRRDVAEAIERQQQGPPPPPPPTRGGGQQSSAA